jgi:hypothetical protein
MFKAFATSLFFIMCISSSAGYGTYLLFGSFWGGFIITSIVQIIGGYLHNTYLERKDKMFIETLQSQVNETPISCELSCAYCNTQNRVPLILSQDNVFKCKHCNQTNKVYIQFSTVRLTSPLVKNEALGELKLLEDEGPTQRQTTLNEPIIISEK